jgi:hypothetical protein
MATPRQPLCAARSRKGITWSSLRSSQRLRAARDTQNAAPPPPPVEPPPECPAVVDVFEFAAPPLEAPLLEPQAAAATPRIATIAIGAKRRAILR